MGLKIIRITTLLDFGGQEKQYVSFTEKKNLLQNEYVFAAIGHGGHAEKKIRANGFRVVVFNSNPAVYNLKNIWKLYKWFKKERPDIVHTAAAEANFHGILAAKLAGIPLIVAEEIGFPNHSGKAKIIFKFVYKFADKVLCVSEAVKKFLVALDEIPPSKGVVIYNPVSTPKALSVSKEAPFTIVTVGRLEKVKNQELLLRAFSEMKSTSSRLLIVGDGREKQRLETLAATLGIADRVLFTGFTSEPEYYLSQAHLFVLPSFSEGFGIAAVEAMLLKVPCLCSNVGGLPEIIDEGATGWLFNPHSESELKDKLLAIMAMEPTALSLIGQNGYRKVAGTFTVENYITQLENFYKILNDKSS